LRISPHRTPPARADREVSYDIPLQNLSAALNAFAATSGMQVLYETSLAEGRMSAPINGIFVPESALRVILADTGLAGRRTDVDAITIVPDMRDQGRSTSTVVPDAQFLGALQASIVNALCARKETRPGDYRLALQIWTTPTGTIRRASLLSTTGMALRDAALAEVLHWGQLEATKAQVQAAERQVKYSESALNGVRDEAQVGQRTTLDVLNAVQALLNARVSLITAQHDRVVASYNLLSAVGGLAPRVLGLPTQIYDPTVHYRQVRDSWFGARTPDGR
jgi:Outer membrane efflux protein